ncbi:hypothetical protein OHB35_49635 [Streptomyces phaeochromogenes]|uniref:Uncharacterized protein n=1 Tax=Streptomyces phaeochromogenes TaxID=1923 RepID=A0ABZ1HT16_STRPH|nr:hypothetical protein [Streptomyces phaeochromogenes]WSD20672.1 hypothetical protein OHB35_49635 [Streptomyces phaeochromogenes]
MPIPSSVLPDGGGSGGAYAVRWASNHYEATVQIAGIDDWL